MKSRILSVALAGLLAAQLFGCATDGGASSVSEPNTSSSSSSSSSSTAPAPEPQPESEPDPSYEPIAKPESEPEPAIEPTVEPSASSAAEAQTVAAAENPFKLDPKGNYSLYAYDHANMVYANLGYAFWSGEVPEFDRMVVAIKAINSLPPLTVGTVDASAAVEGGFLTYDMDGAAKHEYLLQGGMLVVDGTAYELTPEQYAGLKAAAANEGGHGGAQWLVYMNPARVTRIDCVDTDGQLKQMKDENIGTAACEPSYVEVTGGKTYKPGSKSFDGMFNTVFTFDNGVTYTIATDNKSLYIESSDMSYACVYTTSNKIQLESFVETMQGMIAGDANPRTGKPVIYLYPEHTMDVSVKLDFKGRVHYTYPAYNSGWNVTAQPDGTLTNKADGSTHFYLFWDGDADRKDWDFSKGFVVKGTEVEAFFREKLPAMGLTPREYNDFITYWTPELMQNQYNLITFSTAEYEQTAPLAVSPAPDTVLRVHMVYKPLDKPIDIEEQILPPAPERKGFTVVEWGGTRAFRD